MVSATSIPATGEQAPEDRAYPWDRFAGWAPAAAAATLAAFALLLTLAALGNPGSAPAGRAASAGGAEQQDTDLALYDAISRRVADGDNYYESAVAEQRARNFPVRPGPAVRLPTLAVLTAWVGIPGMLAMGALLVLATLIAWWHRLGVEPGGRQRRNVGLMLIVTGAGAATSPHYLFVHEVWSGLLLALALALHRPGRWRASLAAAAAALAFRELALPFVLLFGALAAQRRDWGETAGWATVAVLFALAMYWHFAQVAVLTLPSDQQGSPWLVLRGLDGWVSNVIQSSALHLLPAPAGAMLALLPLVGWAGWKSPAGIAGLLLHAGYGLFFMIAGRSNNFYWALMMMPTWFLGLAFVPQAVASLVRRAAGK